MFDEPCVCDTAFTCLADEHDEPKDPLHRPTRYVPQTGAPVDWPARFRAAAEVVERLGRPEVEVAMLLVVAAWSQSAPSEAVEAIGRALNGETTETETAAELAGRDGDTTDD